MRLRIFSLIVVLLMAASVAAYDWVSVTSYSDVRQMEVVGDRLYLVTSGGLMVIDDAGQPGDMFTNLDGLGTVDLTDLTGNDDGQLWVTGLGRLFTFSPANFRYPISTGSGEPIRLLTVADDGDYLWLGYEDGLILWDMIFDGGQIDDSYHLFADLNPDPTVNDILLIGDSIWLATSAGLAAADRRSTTALKSPAAWQGYSMSGYPALGSERTQSVISFEGLMYFGTDEGLYRLDPVADTLNRVDFAIGSEVHNLRIDGNSLLVYSEAGLGMVRNGLVTEVTLTGVTGGVRTGAVFRGRHWVAGSDGGLYYEEGDSYLPYPYVGLPANDLTDVAVTSDSTLNIFSASLGVFQNEPSGWTQLPVTFSNFGLMLTTDDRNNLYVGSFGSGLSIVGESITKYDTHNSTLQEAGAVGSNYVVCYDIAVTDQYLFAVNFEPRDGTRLAIADLNDIDNLSGWTSLGVDDDLVGTQMVSVDYYDHAVAVGSGVAGAYYYYLGPDPFDKTDDSLVNYTRGNPNFRYRIRSDVVRVVRFSPTGELWVGTNLGLSRFDLGFEMFVPFDLPDGFGPDITDLEFDSRGNVWVGAKNGLARIDGTDGEIEIFTTDNSGLLANQVEAVTFSPVTSNLYVATGSGLSIVPSIFGRPTSDLEQVLAFPNPYIIRNPEDILNFNFSGTGTVRIFTVAGELVADLDQLAWDGRNMAGQPVASGVYLFVLTDSDGEVGRGKFLLVRN